MEYNNNNNKFKVPLVSSTFFEEKKTKYKLSEFIKKSQKLSMGRYCYLFEKKFANIHKVKYATLFNSGGSANLAMIQVLKNLGKIKNGDKIAFSAITWSTNVMPIIQLGCKPIPLDLDPKYLNVNSQEIIKKLKLYNIKAIFLTNILGHCGDMLKIKELCKKKNIILFEDNCEGLGTIAYKKRLGTFGLMSSSSFYVAHHISTIEGGMVITNDFQIDQELKLVRANGWDRNLKERTKKKLRKKNKVFNDFEASYTFYDLGYNLRPTEITGFLGNLQLNKINQIAKTRENNYKYFSKYLIGKNDVNQICTKHINLLSNFAMPIFFKSNKLRELYRKIFEKNKIEIRPLIAGHIEKQPFFKKYVKNKFSLKNTKKIDECSFYFGNYPQLTNTQKTNIVKCLKQIL